MVSLVQWTWVWASSNWWYGEGQGSLACCSPWDWLQRVRHDWATEQTNKSIPPALKLVNYSFLSCLVLLIYTYTNTCVNTYTQASTYTYCRLKRFLRGVFGPKWCQLLSFHSTCSHEKIKNRNKERIITMCPLNVIFNKFTNDY